MLLVGERDSLPNGLVDNTGDGVVAHREFEELRREGALLRGHL
jgi:hypothetical protein